VVEALIRRVRGAKYVVVHMCPPSLVARIRETPSMSVIATTPRCTSKNHIRHCCVDRSQVVQGPLDLANGQITRASSAKASASRAPGGTSVPRL
jgi:type VI protein secretion system component VasA